MIHTLTSQKQFETLLSSHTSFIVWFGAAWCGPCRNLDKAAIDQAGIDATIPIWYCDQTVNAETPDHCNIKAFPTLVFFTKGSSVSSRKSADTFKLCQFIRNASGSN